MSFESKIKTQVLYYCIYKTSYVYILFYKTNRYMELELINKMYQKNIYEPKIHAREIN